jgi:hypothetical protein
MLGRLALTDTVCCTYRAGTRALAWAHTGHPAPLLFRDGTGRRLGTRTRDAQALDTRTLDAQARDTQALGTRAEETLRPGDLLLLHTGAPAVTHRLLALHLAGACSAQEAVRMVTRECAGLGDDTCVLAARVLP